MDDTGGLGSSTSGAGGLGDKAIYHGMAPSKKLALQAFFICVGLGVVASLVVCFVLSNDNRALYVLGINQCITLANCLVLLRWYIKGTLPPNWLWYVVMVGIFLLFQSAITDIMVAEYPYSAPITTTFIPITTHNASNVTTLPPNATTHPTTTPNRSFFEEPTTLPLVLTHGTP